jgi:CRISPR-associated protein Csm3
MTPGRNPRDQRDQFVPGKRLSGYRTYRFHIRAEEGLAVHGGDSGLEIGSTVEPNLRVILNPRTGYPYIPGSSLKGKLRSTLEKILGKYDAQKGTPCACGKADCPVCVIFGAARATSFVMPSAPTRIVVRDAQLTKEAQEVWNAAVRDKKPALELKTESLSNRATGAATHPRTGERVPPGAEFLGEIVLREFAGDDGAKYVETLQKVMKFVAETDGVGSGISRGSGKVSFHDVGIDQHKAPTFP